MILNPGFSSEYLMKSHQGKIELGLPIGCCLDDVLRFKKSQLNVILGHDNVGKTAWIMWYFLCLSVKHGLKWVIWSGENKPQQLVRDLIQMRTGGRVRAMEISEINRQQKQIESWFSFVSNSKMYNHKQLIEMFAHTDAAGCLIDPFTGMDRDFKFSSVYEFLNDSRQFVNATEKSIFINTHAVTEAGRMGGVYPKGHIWGNHLKPPRKADAEFGQAFANRCDDFVILHRLVQHASMKFQTMVNVVKIK